MRAATPLALTLPTDGAASTRRTLTRLLKKLARDALKLPPASHRPGVARALTALQAEIRRFGSQKPAPLYAALRRPHVHVLLTCAWRALADGDHGAARSRAEAFTFQLLAELALDGALGLDLEWPGAPPLGHLLSPPRRLALVLDPAARVQFGPGGVVVDGRPIPAAADAAEFEPVAPGVVLALIDSNPISDFEAHPDKDGNQLDLGAAPAGAWGDALGASLALIERWMPELRAEMDLILRQFVPVGTDDDKHLSASYREAIGTVYLTLHPRLMTMAEAVIHEYQHNKLNALFHLDPVMHNAYWPLYPSPVRPDPRPLHGVLLAAHAFVPVAELYRRMLAVDAPETRSGGFHERASQITAKNAEALAVLTEHADTTPAGQQVLDELVALHGTHGDLA